MKTKGLKSKVILFLTFFLLCSLTGAAQPLPRLEVSHNKRYLIQQDGTAEGKPFFYLGDTGWEMLSRLTKAEVENYFQIRKKQGFNVVLIDSHTYTGTKGSKNYGLEYLSREGFKPFQTGKYFIPEGITEEYWKHADWVISTAERYGFYVAILPYFGNKMVQKERGALINSVDVAYNWGYFLGNRYKDRTNMIWVLGGDYEPKDYKTGLFDLDEYLMPVATAEGIADGINGAARHFDQGKADYSTSVMTYHICSGVSSSKYYHDLKFLDFNAMQSGQYQAGSVANYRMVQEDYLRRPVKPTLDLEPWYETSVWYENIVAKKDGQRCTAFDVRRNAYRSVLAGALGFNYGNNNVWMFYRNNENYEDRYLPNGEWTGDKGIYSEGASQLILMKNLFASRSNFTCSPATALIVDTLTFRIDENRIQAALDENKAFAMAYIPTRQSFHANLFLVDGDVACWWFNPVNGTLCDQSGNPTGKPFRVVNEKKKTSAWQFTSPSNQDWVLVLDNAFAEMPVPGSTTQKQDGPAKNR